jgi:hypothetical protein
MKSVELLFMEGPFIARLQSGQDSWRLVAIEKGSTSRLQNVTDIEPKRFVDSLVFASSQVLEACAANAWKSADVQELDAASRELARVMSKATLGGSDHGDK